MRFISTLLTAFLASCVVASPLPSEANSIEQREDKRLSQASLKKAMKDGSEYIALREEKYTLIVQGGAVNVMMGNRERTGDMDFIATNYVTGPEYSTTLDKLKGAWKYATQESEKAGAAIDPKWADNTIQFFFHGKDALWEKYKNAATSQNYVLSDAGIDEDDGTGLLFLSAPFDWQFVGKMVNVGSVANPHKPYDFNDAADYLRAWLEQNHKTSVKFTEVATWFPAWSQETPEDLIAYSTEINRVAGSELITNIPACSTRRGIVGGPACNMTMSAF